MWGWGVYFTSWDAEDGADAELVEALEEVVSDFDLGHGCVGTAGAELKCRWMECEVVVGLEDW